ncbi:MAG: hypothetical protein ABIH26_01995 [Candidatus Eisenbacteria bacterium]
MGISVDELSELLSVLTAHDPFDIAAGIGGLQLMPENANRLYRLEMAASIVAGLEAKAHTPKMALAQWDAVLNKSFLGSRAVAAAEDPFNYAFTEAVTSTGGSYIVLPGIAGGSGFIVQQLSDAINLLKRPWSDSSFVPAVQSLFRFALGVSNEMSRRARLGRIVDIPERDVRSVSVPDEMRFEELKKAVTFRAKDFDRLMGPNGLDERTRTAFTMDQGSVPFDEMANPSEAPIFAKPILRCGDRYVVIAPCALAAALRHAVILLAQESGLAAELAERYLLAIADTTYRSLDFLRMDRLHMTPAGFARFPCREGIYSFDRDKLAHVLVVSDDLTDYSSRDVFGHWRTEGLGEKISRRLAEVEHFLYSGRPVPNSILQLVVTGGIGRGMGMVVERIEQNPNTEVLLLNAEELHVLGLMELGEPLALWRFARASSEARERSFIIETDTLDEYRLFQAHEYSYYVSDSPFDGMSIVPGGGGRLRMEVKTRRDIHGVHSFNENRIVEVTLLYDDRSVPLYVPVLPSFDRIAVLSEGLRINMWVLAPPTLPAPCYAGLYRRFCDLVAYWLWQASALLPRTGDRLSVTFWDIQVVVSLRESAAWFHGTSEKTLDCTRACRITGRGKLLLDLGPGIMERLSGPDNSEEREILRVVLSALAGALEQEGSREGTELSSEESIGDIVNRCAPRGIKKKLLCFQGTQAVLLAQGSGWPRRIVHPFETSRLLDEVGAVLRRTHGEDTGPIPKEERTRTLNGEVVGYLYRCLEEEVAQLSGGGLIPALIGLNEALLFEEEFRSYSVPTQVACFGKPPGWESDLRREFSDHAITATASRFLIEYVAARPPRGFRPFSLSVYDRLLAITAEIVSWGFLSDRIRFGLSGAVLTVLASGRLEIEDRAYRAAHESFVEEYVVNEVGRRVESFGQRWPADRPEAPEFEEELREATAAEFGLSIYELMAFLGAMGGLPPEQSDKTEGVASGELVRMAQEVLRWETGKVEGALEQFSLRPRQDYLLPPAGYQKADVYPWKFNRALSYLRRPLVIVVEQGEEKVCWGRRNTWKAAEYLAALCVGGRLKAESTRMRRYIGERKREDGKLFNDEVAEFFEGREGVYARRRVKKIRGMRVPDPDIDVLVADRDRREILVLETKSLAMARTPLEVKNELDALVHSRPGRRSTAEIHGQRAKWIGERGQAVLEELGVPAEKAVDWSTRAHIVTDREAISAYLTVTEPPIISFQRLKLTWDRRATEGSDLEGEDARRCRPASD